MKVLQCYVLFCGMTCAPFHMSAEALMSDPAAIQVQNLDAGLLKSMQAAASTTVVDRYHTLTPVIEQAFDLPLMTKLSIGPDWASFTPQQQQALVAGFSRLTIASYVHNFHKFDGEKFDVDANVQTRGADKIVQTRIISPGAEPANVAYRLRPSGQTWKIIDVYFDGISQLTLHRSDFSAAISSGGAPLLIKHLNELGDDLMKP